MHSVYVPGASPLHALHPLTKLAGAALVLAAVFALPWPAALPALLALVLALAAIGGVLPTLLRRLLLLLAPVICSLLLIQGLLFPPERITPLTVGPLTIWAEGLRFALTTAVRLLTLTGTMLLLVQTTHPADLVAALTAIGAPRSVGYIILVALQLLPDMAARANAILEAQRSRGLETEGVLRRLRSLPALVAPLIVGALVDVEARALALESRAFAARGPKTTLRALRDTPGQRTARWLLLGAAGALLLLRLTLLRGAG
ncbi:MAG TPA: energy-coupling factor transporter transmembrane component T [Roseiflexaceae bacterium]|nr:energy-coupling factor transporter transmembrane component T [Roseiflexaceae bacterium]